MEQIYDSRHSGQEVDNAVDAVQTTIPNQLTQIGSECSQNTKARIIYNGMLDKENSSVNLIDFSDLLYGYTTSQGSWVELEGAICTNAIEGVQGDTFTSQGIMGFASYPNNIYVCEFDESGNFLGRKTVAMSDTTNQIATFSLSYADTAFFRVVLQATSDSSNLGVGGLTDIQIESGSTATTIDTDGAQYTYYIQQSSVKDLTANMSALQSSITDNAEAIENIEDSITGSETTLQTIATGDDVYTDKWYILSGTSVSISTNVTTLDYRGYVVSAVEGDIFILSTRGGTASGRSYAIASSDGTILEVATTSEADLISSPKTIEITQDNAAYLYMNCHNDCLSSFSLKKQVTTTYDRIESLETSVENQAADVATFAARVESNLEANAILLIGASFAYSANTWFEQACERLGLTAINEAVSGSRIHDDVLRLMNGTLFTDINAFDFLAIMHVHNYNINALSSTYEDYTAEDYEADEDFLTAMQTPTVNNAWWSAAYDYFIKKYQALCYAEKDNSSSPWYGTQHGKPCNIIICTSWHDARQTINTSVKEIAEKWGLYLCNFADNIGFSCQKNNFATGAQPSIIFANETEELTFSIDGVSGTHTVGWHPLRGRSQYIQKKMAKIFADCVDAHIW